jgi:hypothetical protein
MSEANVSEMFAAPAGELETTAARLAEEIAVEENTLDNLKEQVKLADAEVKTKKAELATLLMQAGLDSIKLTSGLTPRVKIKRRYYTQSGIDKEHVHSWLMANELGDIILPTVNFNTLQATLKEHQDAGRDIPETIFNVVDEPGIVMHGKSKFLKAKENGQ